MENKSLLLISQEMARMAAQLVELGGELTPEMEQLMDLNTGELRQKADRYKLFMDALNANSLYLKDLEVQFKAGRKTAENRIQQMRDNIKYAMSERGEDILEGTAWVFKRSRIAPKLVIDDLADIPSKYKREEIVKTEVLDKEGLMADLGLGTQVPGCHVEDNYQLRTLVNKPGRARAVTEASNG